MMTMGVRHGFETKTVPYNITYTWLVLCHRAEKLDTYGNILCHILGFLKYFHFSAGDNLGRVRRVEARLICNIYQ